MVNFKLAKKDEKVVTLIVTSVGQRKICNAGELGVKHASQVFFVFVFCFLFFVFVCLFFFFCSL